MRCSLVSVCIKWYLPVGSKIRQRSQLWEIKVIYYKKKLLMVFYSVFMWNRRVHFFLSSNFPPFAWSVFELIKTMPNLSKCTCIHFMRLTARQLQSDFFMDLNTSDQITEIKFCKKSMNTIKLSSNINVSNDILNKFLTVKRAL